MKTRYEYVTIMPMTTVTTPQRQIEQKLMAIARRLPPERLTHLVAFARFLEDELDSDKATASYTEADARWDDLLASPEGQRTLLKLAREAQEEYEAGQTTEIIVTDDDRLAPG